MAELTALDNSSSEHFDFNRRHFLIGATISLVVAIGLALFFVLSPYEAAPYDDEANARLRFLVLLFLGGYWVTLVLIVRPLVTSLGKIPLFGVNAIITIWAIMHLVTRMDSSFAQWFFNPSGENSSGAIMSSALLLAVGLSSLAIGLLAQARQEWIRGYWAFVGIGFLFLSMDEYFSLHESVSFWRTGYMAFGAFLALGSLAVFWSAYRDMPHVFGLIIVGLGVMGFSGVAMDAFSNDHALSFGPIEYNGFRCAHYELGVECHSYGIIEEFLEFTGITFILAAMWSFMQVFVDRSKRTSSIIAAVAALWIAFTVVYFWVVPVIEARVVAEDINVTYNEGLFTLRGYELSHTETVQAGDTVSGSLYVDLGESIPNNYAATVQLWAKPSQEKIAQYDSPLGVEYRTSAWIPNITVSTDFEFQIPENVSTPATYWLIVKLWEGFPDEEGRYILGEPLVIDNQEGLRMLDELQDTFILTNLVALSEETPEAPPQTVDYFFSDGFRLYGYDMPAEAESGSELVLDFWWLNESPNRSLIQFIHLFHQQSDAIFTFDEQTFDGAHPPEDWVAGVRMRDTRTLQLPADMPSGSYDVIMGMYEVNSGERVIITDAEGQTVENFAIPLGTLTVE